MEWVIAALAIGCLFFAIQVVVDYVKYKAVIAPRIRRLEDAKKELEAKIEASKAELNERRDQLDPLRGEIGQLEQQYLDLQQQIQDERGTQRSQSPLIGKGSRRFRPR